MTLNSSRSSPSSFRLPNLLKASCGLKVGVRSNILKIWFQTKLNEKYWFLIIIPNFGRIREVFSKSEIVKKDEHLPLPLFWFIDWFMQFCSCDGKDDPSMIFYRNNVKLNEHEEYLKDKYAKTIKN